MKKNSETNPLLVIISGPNGAGKTTSALKILPREFEIKRFVNADFIARGLSPLDPSLSEIEAGRLMLKQINELAEKGESFAFETTLSSRVFVNFIKKYKQKGYRVCILFISLSSPELAIQRVKARVAKGGHNVPENVIRRRYLRGIKNFFELYKPLADYWILGDNSSSNIELVANGVGDESISFHNKDKFDIISLRLNDQES